AAKPAPIRDSRVQGTQLLCDTLAQLDQPPKVLVCASAIGYYGSRGDAWLREDSAAGTDFLAEVCQAWEAATEPARRRGIRVVHQRFGVILSPAGGALAKMLAPFKLGAGGVIGKGQQHMSWIALDDVVGATYHALMTDTLHGPVNVVSPQPVTNREYTRVLGRVLRRPTLAPLPAFAARLAFGEMAEALFLASSRVAPARLIDSGYVFRYPELTGALQHLLGRSTARSITDCNGSRPGPQALP
ncbi:MAG: TIGR01777 family oxidoreductase, partial [Candidatus Tectomicrobia bacterium]|nr:TIGR01777 family oxidoreductase [Candidatus Tectomicrobia bacterium]